jgi:spore germination protein YaaH
MTNKKNVIYEVQHGDNLGSIANTHGTNVEQMRAMNPEHKDDNSPLNPGMKLVVPPEYHVKKTGKYLPFTKVSSIGAVHSETKEGPPIGSDALHALNKNLTGIHKEGSPDPIAHTDDLPPGAKVALSGDSSNTSDL